MYLKASGYDRNGESSCKTRIHNLISVYKNYNDIKPNSAGSGPPKKPSYFEEIDMVLKDKPTKNQA